MQTLSDGLDNSNKFCLVLVDVHEILFSPLLNNRWSVAIVRGVVISLWKMFHVRETPMQKNSFFFLSEKSTRWAALLRLSMIILIWPISADRDEEHHPLNSPGKQTKARWQAVLFKFSRSQSTAYDPAGSPVASVYQTISDELYLGQPGPDAILPADLLGC